MHVAQPLMSRSNPALTGRIADQRAATCSRLPALRGWLPRWRIPIRALRAKAFAGWQGPEWVQKSCHRRPQGQVLKAIAYGPAINGRMSP